MELNEVQHADFRENGFMVVRNVLSPEEVATLRQRADEIIGDVEAYRQRDTAERQRLQELHKQDVEELPRYNTFAEQPEERITGRYARRGDRVYPVRQRPIDEAAVAAAQASDNPWQRFGSTLDHLADNDAVFRTFAAHPNVVKVLQELLAPNLKLWFDHLYNKPPYNDGGPYGGANRFHQDGFFQFSRRSVTCWIALDEVTEENGCFHYVPIAADYGQVQFDEGVAEELTAERLEQTVLVTLKPGDAAFHDRWTMHATGPNETGQHRRGWAMHYCDAESQFGNFANDDPWWEHAYYQSPDGVHIRDNIVAGNRRYLLVAGQEFPGCV